MREWPFDGWEIWHALVSDLLDDDREQGLSAFAMVLADYMKRSGIEIRGDHVFYRGRLYTPEPYPECSVLTEMLPRIRT